MSEDLKNTGLYLYLSNDLDILARRFTGEIKGLKTSNPIKAGLAAIVQTEGTIKFLSLKIAEELGICANFGFLYPRDFILYVLRECGLIAERDIGYFEKSNMAVEILKLLKDGGGGIFAAEQNAGRYAAYMQDGVNLGQFAVHMADIFDQYMVYRPEFAADTSKIKDAWQRELFEGMLGGGGAKRVTLAEAATKFIKSDRGTYGGRLGGLPDAIYLFAISVLPPVYIEFFKKRSEDRRINNYNIKPSKEYWFDGLSDKEAALLVKKEKMRLGGGPLHISGTNPVFINNARLLQNFYYFLYSGEPAPSEIEEYDEFAGVGVGGKNTLLSRIKRDMLDNAPELTGPPPSCSAPHSADPDLSLQVHSYHSKFRETEGLYNYACSIMQEDPSVALEDILVMSPDIEEYAPYIDGVFSDKGMAYNVSDNRMLKNDTGIRSLLAILQMLKGGLTAKDLVSLFELEPLREKMELDQSAYETILNWIKGLNIRWGLTEDYVGSLYPDAGTGEPWVEPYNTVEYAAKRLFAGYISGSDGLISGIMPYAGISLSNMDAAGKFLFVIDKIAELTELVQKESTLKEFGGLLQNVVNLFISDGYSKTGDFAGFTARAKDLDDDGTPVSFGTYMELLKNITMETRNTYNFMRGGITFCELLPLRSIPFKVICLLGLNDATFPRKPAVPLFNQIEKEHRRGDRSPRLNDRLLFLESILSAKDYLYISYIGKNLKNNKPVNPSITVSELMDYAGIEAVPHPLHSFSPEYFYAEGRKNLVNFSREDFELAKVLTGETSPGKPCSGYNNGGGGVVEKCAPAAGNIILLKELDAFLKDPVKTYFNRNGIYLYSEEDEAKSEEAVNLDPLEEYRLRKKIFAGEADDFEMLKRTGLLPHANAGKYQFDRIRSEVGSFKLRIEKLCAAALEDFKPRAVKRQAGGSAIEGAIGYVRESDEGRSLIMLDFGKSGFAKKDGMAFRLLLLKILGECGRTYFASFGELKEITFNYGGEADRKNKEEAFLKLAVEFYGAALNDPLPLYREIYGRICEKRREGRVAAITEGELAEVLSGRAETWNSGEDPYVKLLIGRFGDFACEEYLEKITYFNAGFFGLADFSGN